MKVAVFGLGYVGASRRPCLASRGHEVIGVDVSPAEGRPDQRGQSPVVEAGIGELVAEVVAAGRAARDHRRRRGGRRRPTSRWSALGTPSAGQRQPVHHGYLERVCKRSAPRWPRRPGGTPSVFRSTMLPGHRCDLLVPILEKASGKTPAVDFGVAATPSSCARARASRTSSSRPRRSSGSRRRARRRGGRAVRGPAARGLPGADPRGRDDQVRRQLVPRA